MLHAGLQDLMLLLLQAGLSVLEGDPNVMKCYNGTVEAQTFSEMGASAAMLKANYTLSAFMTRYRKVDWLERGNWGCNER